MFELVAIDVVILVGMGRIVINRLGAAQEAELAEVGEESEEA